MMFMNNTLRKYIKPYDSAVTESTHKKRANSTRNNGKALLGHFSTLATSGTAVVQYLAINNILV